MRYQKEKNLFFRQKSRTWILAMGIGAVCIGLCTYFVAVNWLNTDDLDTTPKNTGDDNLWSGQSPDALVNQNDTTQQKPSGSSPQPSSPQTQSSSPSDLSDEPESQETSQSLQKLQFILPAAGEIISPFNGDTLVKDATLGDWRTHNGIDIRTGQGAEVFAASDGVVQNIEDTDLWGTVVTLTYQNGYVGTYCLLHPETEVKIGQKVLLGDKIGRVGDTKSIINESALDTHLHYELKKDGKFVDPAAVVE